MFVGIDIEDEQSFKSYKGSQNFEIWSRDLGHAHFGSFYDADAVGVRPLCLRQI